MAARIREELGLEVELANGPFGSAKVLVDGEKVAGTGLSGWLPPTRVIIDRIKAKLDSVQLPK